MNTDRIYQNKKYILSISIIFLVLVFFAALVLVGIFFLKPAAPAKTAHLISNDKKVILDISTDALPEGVRVEDITITKKTAGDFEGAPESDSVLIYKLEPDGLEFKKPQKITLVADLMSEKAVPFILHRYKDTTTALDNVTVETNTEKGTVTITAEIPHFSFIAAELKDTLFEWSVSPSEAGEYEIGQSIPFQITVTHREYNWGGYTISVGTGSSVSYNADTNRGHHKIITFGPISPSEVVLEPFTQAERHPFVISQNFTCESRGRASIGMVRGLSIYYVFQTRMLGVGGLSRIETTNTSTHLHPESPRYLCEEETSQVEIPALQYYSATTMTEKWFPYPDRQFTKEGPHGFLTDPNEGNCANDHYHGRGLTIDMEWLDEPMPQYGCGWSAALVRNISVSSQKLAEWERRFAESR